MLRIKARIEAPTGHKDLVRVEEVTIVLGDEALAEIAKATQGNRFIPCTTPVNAVFKDGESYPVIFWNVKDGVLVGMIVEGNSPYLVDVTYFGADFARYEYPTEV